MSVKITIKGRTVDFPVSGDSPDWGPAVTEFAQSVEEAINSVAGTFDVAPQIQIIDASNPGTNVIIDNLLFPPTDVQGATIYYAVYRKTDETTLGSADNVSVSEAGQLVISYNEGSGVFEMSRQGSGDASIEFDITNTGQIRFTTSTLTGINHTGYISYRALSVLNS